MQTLKLLSNTISIAAANNVFNAKAVYIQNVGAAAANVIQANSTGGQLASLTLLPNTAVVIIKAPSDTLANAAAATLTATSVGFTN